LKTQYGIRADDEMNTDKRETAGQTFYS
jgi:hypothetical protein